MSQVPPKLACASSTTKLRARALLREVVGAADAGDAGADDQHVEVLGLLACRHGARVADVHELVPFGRWISVPGSRLLRGGPALPCLGRPSRRRNRPSAADSIRARGWGSRHIAPSRPFPSCPPKVGWRTKAVLTHSTSMVRGRRGRCQERHRAPLSRLGLGRPPPFAHSARRSLSTRMRQPGHEFSVSATSAAARVVGGIDPDRGRPPPAGAGGPPGSARGAPRRPWRARRRALRRAARPGRSGRRAGVSRPRPLWWCSVLYQGKKSWQSARASWIEPNRPGTPAGTSGS